MSPRSRRQPRVRNVLRPVGTSAVMLALLAGGTGTASAAANTTCPQAFETITVADAVTEGYLRVAKFDLNGDGIVCRVALGDGIFHHLHPSVDTIYEWQDNSTPRG